VNTLPSRSIIKLSDLLQSEVSDKYYQTDAWLKWWGRNKENQLAKMYSTLDDTLANCLTARMYKSWNGNFVTQNGRIRRLTTLECERLQTLPERYTSMISDSKAYEAIGNGWTVDIITHILKHYKPNKNEKSNL